jgi:hypothetical protein
MYLIWIGANWEGKWASGGQANRLKDGQGRDIEGLDGMGEREKMEPELLGGI